MTEAAILKCRGEDFVTYQSNQAVYSTEVDSCCLSLYLQRKDARELCKRTVIAAEHPQAGFFKGVETCYLTLQGLQLYPALRGETEFSARIPVLFTPAVPAAASADEMVISSLNLKVCYLCNQVLLVLNVRIGLSQIQK